MITAVAVGAAAALGAIARYLLDQTVTRRLRTVFPLGTWLINITGSFVLGLIAGTAAHHGLSPRVVAIVGTGVCGGYTTFSTFSHDTIRLMEDGSGLTALGNAVGSIASGLAAAALGLGLALVL
ncbi:MAG TPA: fluoride efflux transporter CrcB [Actinocrinis sp.]|uniref:fluoride efflux transporter CrcB n=1 Tax=Actinocrinis sp. TaxID=1920516 RepID=UPI002DDD248D|nr:fluoride efflux transporter CrcB [Actinocrinis sp.]HEV3172587.1 fluoride efflux transporter CrcB [Actinocrinis sp.]